MFSEAQYTAVLNELDAGMATLADRLAQVGPTVRSATSNPLMPWFVADALVAQGNKLVEIGAEIRAKIGECLEGAAAPILFYFRAYAWVRDVGTPASHVAGSIHPSALRARNDWTGTAATRYTNAVANQTTAAAEIQSISQTMALALAVCATSGLAFYVALAVILVKVIAATIAAIAALGSVVFSWAGVLIIIEEAAVSGAMIWAAVAALSALLAAQATQIVSIKAAASAADAFPGGHWPVGAP